MSPEQIIPVPHRLTADPLLDMTSREADLTTPSPLTSLADANVREMKENFGRSDLPTHANLAIYSIAVVALVTGIAAGLAFILKAPVERTIALVALILAISAFLGLIVTRTQNRSAWEKSQHRINLIACINQIAGDFPSPSPHPFEGTMLTSISSDVRLFSLAKLAKETFAMDRAGILMLRPQASELQLLTSCGDMPKHLPTRFSLDEMPACRTAIDTGEPVLIGAAIAGSLDLPRNRGLLSFFNASSAILIPLTVGQERIGLISLSASDVRRLGPDDRELSDLFARYAGLILLRARAVSRMAAAVEGQRRLVEQRDALWAVNAAAFEAATWEAALHTIVERVPAALGVDICCIAISQDNPEEMAVVALTGGRQRELFPAPLVVTGLYCGRAMLTRQTIVIADGRDDPCVDPLVRRLLTVGSILYLPLMKPGSKPTPTDGESAALPEVYGIMALIREKPGGFETEQVGLAEVFASRASSIIERARLREQTERLLEQATRDADTRAVLLSELNHRVKNNLAGIVGLLMAKPPGLDEANPAKAWIDRVADRVRTMADAHDLFVGVIGDVELPALVDRVVGGLPIEPGGRIRLSVDTQSASDVCVGSARAIPLAMALHELCFNAFVHGLQAGGELSIVARRNGPTLELTVHDTGGRASGEAVVHRTSGGLGLTLVRGLVSRELKGTFELTVRETDGTTAHLSIPIA